MSRAYQWLPEEHVDHDRGANLKKDEIWEIANFSLRYLFSTPTQSKTIELRLLIHPQKCLSNTCI